MCKYCAYSVAGTRLVDRATLYLESTNNSRYILGDAAWKKFERRVARPLGGERRGPDTSTVGGGKTDTIGTEPYAIECKYRAKPSFTDCEAAVDQAERNAHDASLCPIGVIHRKGDEVDNSLVVMRFSTFLDWFGPLQAAIPIE